MSELEQARKRRGELRERMKQAQEAAAGAGDCAERTRQRERARILKEMYREACGEVRRLEGKGAAPVPEKQKRNVDVALNCGAVWADLEGVSWGQIEGRPWPETPSTGRQVKRINELVRAAAGLCSQQQKLYLSAYYTEGLTQEEIGERFGTERSTVSRTLTRARGRMERYISAKLLLGRCVDGRGRFDYMKFLNSAAVLTERQKEMVYLILTRDTSCRDIAEYLGRTAKTVCKTVDRAEEKLSALAVTLDERWSAVTIRRSDWAGRSEKELAQELGLSPSFYYRVVRRGECVEGIPLLHCAILHRLAAGESVKSAAKGLGCSAELVKRVRKTYAGRALPDFTEDYRPCPVRREKCGGNPFAMAGDAVIDRIDAETYRALQERFGGDYADT